MNYLILTDCFYPQSKSASRHIYDLAEELVRRKNNVCIVCPGYNKISVNKKLNKKIKILREKKFNNKNKNYFIRGFQEILLPFKFYKLICNNIKTVDKLIVYSPSIFFGLILKKIKKKYNCKVILLLRDVFPEWAAQINILKKNSFIFFFLKYISNLQFKFSDTICLQSKKDYNLINKFYKIPNKKKKILYNWITIKKIKYKRDNLKKYFKIVFGGTVGPAQNWGNIIFLIKKTILLNKKIIFFIVGDGMEKNKILKTLNNINSNKILFLNSMKEDDYLSFIKNCDLGILSLNKNILFDNFPGKFFSYMEANLPILSDLPDEHQLAKLIKKYKIGLNSDPDNKEKFFINLKKIYSTSVRKKLLKENYNKIHKNFFSTIKACDIIEEI